ncbi:olfactory receptor 52P1-like [Emydura macquarii macquarii]|uniref:olfactory receptor 52P1-like n=1 Tax=Emydura macquarii macquarii TaxID=1129001 RepID=UPI00352B973B
MCTLNITEPDRSFDHLMTGFNLTSSDLSTFILNGIPGLEAAHIWISIPFSTKESTLHKPMFLLLCMLALTDIEPLLLRRLPFYANRVIPHTYCEPSAVMKMSSGDTRVIRMYTFVTLLVIIGLDQTLIGLSYGLIIRAVLRISSKKAHRKALNTCTAHICVMLMYYTPFLFSALTHRFSQGINAHVHILLANLNLLVPPMFNPIIYGVKTKKLRDKVGKYTCRMYSPAATDFKPV